MYACPWRNGDEDTTAADLCAPKAFPGANAHVLPKRTASDTRVATKDFIFLLFLLSGLRRVFTCDYNIV